MDKSIAFAKLLDLALQSSGEDHQTYLGRVFLRLRFSLDIITTDSNNGGSITLVELMMSHDHDDEDSSLSSASTEDPSEDGALTSRIGKRSNNTFQRVSNRKIEEWSVIVHGCLSDGPRGDTGRMEDLFHKGKLVDPHQMIAILFSELVDFFFDDDGTAVTRSSGGVRSNQFIGRLLEDVYRVDDEGHVFLLQQEEQSSCSVASELVMSIFGYNDTFNKPRFPRRPFAAFLSAIVAAKCLNNYIPMADLAKIVTCIHCTILPYKEEENELMTNLLYINTEKDKNLAAQNSFRISSLSPGELLYRTLADINDEYGLQMADCELITVIQRGIGLLNRVMEPYATDDVGNYLDHLWTALAMVTPSIRYRKLQTVSDFHEGLTNLQYMLHTFNAYQWLESFRGEPNILELSALADRIGENLEYGMIYCKARLLAFAILAAFATLTGGNVPLSYFVGDPPTENRRTNQLGDTLKLPELSEVAGDSTYNDDNGPEEEKEEQNDDDQLSQLLQDSFVFNGAEKPMSSSTSSSSKTVNLQSNKCNMVVYNILRGGRKTVLRFDTCKSPLAAFGYGMIGDEGLEKVAPYLPYPMTPEKAKSLLFTLPSEVSLPICKEISGIVNGPRLKELHAIHDELVNHAKKI